MILLEALPADDGDCLWIEWPDAHGATHRMLVDGGRGSPRQIPPGLADRLARQPEDQRTFDLVVCTHIDVDHIGGLLALAGDPPAGFRAADVWFNGRRHLDLLGPAQGDTLSDALTRHSVRRRPGQGRAARHRAARPAGNAAFSHPGPARHAGPVLAAGAGRGRDRPRAGRSCA